jgi:hypothetical protein
MSLPVLGVRGWLKSNCGLDVLGNNGHMEASSSAIKVDCDGDVVSESGNCKNDASDDTMGFIFSKTQFFYLLRCSRHENSMRNKNLDQKYFPSNFFLFSLVWRFKIFSIVIN